MERFFVALLLRMTGRILRSFRFLRMVYFFDKLKTAPIFRCGFFAR